MICLKAIPIYYVFNIRNAFIIPFLNIKKVFSISRFRLCVVKKGTLKICLISIMWVLVFLGPGLSASNVESWPSTPQFLFFRKNFCIPFYSVLRLWWSWNSIRQQCCGGLSKLEGVRFCNLPINELHHLHFNLFWKMFENIHKRSKIFWQLATEIC